MLRDPVGCDEWSIGPCRVVHCDEMCTEMGPPVYVKSLDKVRVPLPVCRVSL
jgi:hypothetical protein